MPTPNYKTPTYTTWRAMKQRCNRPSSTTFCRYGAKGVKICPQWERFDKFLADMGERPTGKTIDRIDPCGDYEPSNCRWATPEQQAENRSCTLRATIKGETLLVKTWCERLGLSYKQVLKRTYRGWTIERALTTPFPACK